MSYLVHLQKFEGPMGLLLHLIRKDEMDIFDINVSELTRQYLDYIRMMRELDLEVAGEFVSMAATLLHIKSRLLLPQYGEDGEPLEQPEDPRQELVQKILEYQKYQEAGKKLYERPLLSRDLWTRGRKEDYLGSADGEGEIILDEDGLFGLIAVYRKAIRKAGKSVHQVRAKGQSIAGRILELRDRLIVGVRVNMRDLLEGAGALAPFEARKQLLITFLSMLELGRMGFVSLFQNETYGDIYVEAFRPIDRNVLERVQEFDSAESEGLAERLIERSAREAASDLAQDIAADLASPQESFDLRHAVAEADDFADGDRGAEQAASDDDIRMAETELGPETAELDA